VEIFPCGAAFARGVGHELMSTFFITEASIVARDHQFLEPGALR
jgi:hypothetical protein